MANPLKSEKSTSLGLLMARLPIGVLLLLQGWNKWKNLGVTNFVAAHLPEVPKYMPPWFPSAYLNAIPYAEMAFGLFFLLGFMTRLSGFMVSAMLISFIIAETGIGYKEPGYGWLEHQNIVFVGVTLLLFLAGPGRISVDHLLFGSKPAGKPNWD